MNNYEFVEPTNVGVLKEKLPKELYTKLLNECLEAKIKNEQFSTGLTGSGVPDHFYLKDDENKFKEFLLPLINSYFQKYPEYLNSQNYLTKDVPLFIDTPWINLQKKYEYLPNHHHDGVLSYTVWIKIPYELEEEKNYKKLKFKNQKQYTFQFSYNDVLGNTRLWDLDISKNDEGTMLLFPSKLIHCVYPFYTSDDYRISISGNIKFKVD